MSPNATEMICYITKTNVSRTSAKKFRISMINDYKGHVKMDPMKFRHNFPVPLI